MSGVTLQVVKGTDFLKFSEGYTNVEELKAMAAQNQSLTEVENQINQLYDSEFTTENLGKLIKLIDRYSYMLDPAGYIQQQQSREQYAEFLKSVG